MYQPPWDPRAYGMLYGACAPQPVGELQSSQAAPINGDELKRRDHAVNVTVKLPPNAEPDMWQLVRKLLRFCGPCTENRATTDSIRNRFFSITGALNCLDHLNRLCLHHSLPALVIKTDEKLANELLEYRVMANALDPHHQHTNDMVKRTIMRFVHEWRDEYQARYAEAPPPDVPPPAYDGQPSDSVGVEVVGVGHKEGVEAAEEAIRAIQEIGALISDEPIQVEPSPERPPPPQRTNKDARQAMRQQQELEALVQERRQWEMEVERREYEEEQRRAWEREKWRRRQAGFVDSDDEEAHQQRLGYERALRRLERRGQEPFGSTAPAPERRMPSSRRPGDILRALNDTPLDLQDDAGAAPWLPSDEEPLDGSDGFDSPVPPVVTKPETPPEPPDSDDELFARRKAERDRGRQLREAQRQKELENERLQERIRSIQQRNRERLKLLGIMNEKPPVKKMPTRALSDSESSTLDSTVKTNSRQRSPGSDTDEDIRRAKRVRQQRAAMAKMQQMSNGNAANDSSDDAGPPQLQKRSKHQQDAQTRSSPPPQPVAVPTTTQSHKLPAVKVEDAEPSSPVSSSALSDPVPPPPKDTGALDTSPIPLTQQTVDTSAGVAIPASDSQQGPHGPLKQEPMQQVVKKVPAKKAPPSLITPANPSHKFTLAKGGKLRQVSSHAS